MGANEPFDSQIYTPSYALATLSLMVVKLPMSMTLTSCPSPCHNLHLSKNHHEITNMMLDLPTLLLNDHDLSHTMSHNIQRCFLW
jgi:hypothetical protein